MDKKKYETINVDGTEYTTLNTTKNSQRKSWTPVNECHISSFIPGTVREIFVEENQELKKGTPIMILEAMKMRNVIEAPFDAKIVRINVETGKSIPKRFVMIELEKIISIIE